MSTADRRDGPHYTNCAFMKDRTMRCDCTAGADTSGMTRPDAEAPRPRPVPPHTPGMGYTCRACEQPHIPSCIRDRDENFHCRNLPDAEAPRMTQKGRMYRGGTFEPRDYSVTCGAHGCDEHTSAQSADDLRNRGWHLDKKGGYGWICPKCQEGGPLPEDQS